MSRTTRNLWLTAASVIVLALGALIAPYADTWERVSVVSAWLCMVLMAGALLIGPLRRLRGEPSPVNIYLRRDLGLWAALHGLLHFVAGNVVAMNAAYVAAFVHTPGGGLSVAVRDPLFTIGASTGTIVALLFLILMAVSSDRALRLLGTKKWKWLQRSAHLALWLTVIHGISYQLLELRWLPLVLFSAVSLAIFVLQYRGRRRESVT